MALFMSVYSCFCTSLNSKKEHFNFHLTSFKNNNSEDMCVIYANRLIIIINLRYSIDKELRNIKFIAISRLLLNEYNT